MKTRFALLLTLALAATSANAAVIGEDPLEGGGSPDGWSGLSYLTDDYPEIPVGEGVATFNYYAVGDRANGDGNIQPVIVRDDAGVLSVWDVGPVDTPLEEGEQSVAWNSSPIPGDGASYYAGIWQWRTGVDDTEGGLVPFNGDGGSGMMQINLDGTTYVPAAGDPLDAPGHMSAPGGRAYQFNFETSIIEPATADFNQDGVVDVLDFEKLSDNLAAHLDGDVTNLDGDYDRDRDIDLDDFGKFKADFPAVVAAALSGSVVPEPRSMVLLASGLLALWGYSRRRYR